MSVQALSLAFSHEGLTPIEKLVLLTLANYADEAMRCWPSQKRLASDTGLTDRTVRKALASLGDRGIVEREERRRDDGSRASDVIHLRFQQAERRSGGAEPGSGGVREDASRPAEPEDRDAAAGPAHAEGLSGGAERRSEGGEFRSGGAEPDSGGVRNVVPGGAERRSGREPTTEPTRGTSPSLRSGEARARARRSNRCPDDWTPKPSTLAFAEAEGMTPGEVERELSKMRDHEFARPRTDWDAAFRNWIRTARDRQPPRRTDNLARAFAAARAVAGSA